MVPISDLSFLVVDDQTFQRNVLATALETLNAKSVLAASTGRDALQLLKTAGPADVIITDLQLPGMDGLELIRHIGAARYSPAVIIAGTLERGVLACVEAMSAAYGVNFLGTAQKPITARRLKELVEQHGPLPVPAPRPEPVTTFTPDEIVEGLENGEFEPFFQPKIELKTGRVVGTEALARWRHPQQGIVLPEAFIKPLEDSGKIHMLLRSILRQGAQFCRMLRDAGQECTMSVNLSFESLTDVTLAEQITTVVASQNVEPGNIILEITESAATTEVGGGLENLARLRITGFGLSIDDYGRGASSIDKLARIPFGEMKVDRPLLVRASRHESARVVFESSLDLARRLKMRTVAEGVETQAEWDLLLELECDMAQGDYIAKPMSRARYKAWLRGWTTKVAARGQAV